MIKVRISEKKGKTNIELYGEEKAKKIKNKLRISHLNQCPKSCFKIGHTAWNKGLTKETNEQVRKYAESISKEKSSHWKGGSSTYYHTIARKIMNVKDKKLVVHHLDGDYTNNNYKNLFVISLSRHSGFHHFKHGKYSKLIKLITEVGGKQKWEILENLQKNMNHKQLTTSPNLKPLA